ncbi:hypothetical protein [Fibrella aquatilis]|uniref:hypothetical protein n=1 Tax=Fibrella aquatilis TaxID=2817059 RepID=UPI001E4F632D|nr:hypothetical protein [Fibrella aquatilis]
MTKSERRYCRLASNQSDPDYAYWRLFDCLLRHETMDDTLTTELAELFPGATLDPARKHLYQTLMQRLRQFDGDRRIDVRIGQLMHESQLLYERGLVQFSGEQLARAQRLAEQHERGEYAVLVARQRAEQWVRGQFDGVSLDALTAHHANIDWQLTKTQTAVHHAALYETLLLRYHTNGTVSTPADTLKLNDLLLEEYQLLSRQKEKSNRGTGATARSFAMQQQHLHFQSAYLRMIGDEAGSLVVYRELDALFQQNPMLWAEQPQYYVQLLDGILVDLRMLRQYDQMPYFIDRLRAINDLGLRQTVAYIVLYHSLLIMVDQGLFDEAVAILGTQWPDSVVFERGLAQRSLIFRTEMDLLLVRLDIGLGHLSVALSRLNRVISRPVRSLPQTLYTQIRLMNLLLHARLGNAEYLTYALRAVERKPPYQGKRLPSETTTLVLIRQWLGGRLRANSLTQPKEIGDSPADRQLRQNLDLGAWVKAVSK